MSAEYRKRLRLDNNQVTPTQGKKSNRTTPPIVRRNPAKQPRDPRRPTLAQLLGVKPTTKLVQNPDLNSGRIQVRLPKVNQQVDNAIEMDSASRQLAATILQEMDTVLPPGNPSQFPTTKADFTPIVRVSAEETANVSNTQVADDDEDGLFE